MVDFEEDETHVGGEQGSSSGQASGCAEQTSGTSYSDPGPSASMVQPGIQYDENQYGQEQEALWIEQIQADRYHDVEWSMDVEEPEVEQVRSSHFGSVDQVQSSLLYRGRTAPRTPRPDIFIRAICVTARGRQRSSEWADQIARGKGWFYILYDSGADEHCCPADFAEQYGHVEGPSEGTLRNASGGIIPAGGFRWILLRCRQAQASISLRQRGPRFVRLSDRY